MFTSHQLAAQIRTQQAAAKALDRADMFSAGTLVTAPGGHGTEYGVTIPTITRPDEAQAFVDARIAEGSDYIKIVYDDGKSWGMKFATLNKETLAAVISAAHKRGKLAVVHTGTLQDFREAIEAGADGLVHLFADRLPDRDFDRLVAAKRAFVIPTLTILQAMIDGPDAAFATDSSVAPYLSYEDARHLKRAFPSRPGAYERYSVAEQAVRRLKAAKVPILAGTDALNPGLLHGASLHRELELLVRAGLKPIEALAAATSVPAQHFRLADRGRIAPGRRADLVLVKGDPTTDIKATRNIVGVWKLGVPVDRQAYSAGIERQKAETQRQRQALPPSGSESGWVSDFEEGKPGSKFGSGWTVSTDRMMGGKSTAEFKVVPAGANDSKFSLSISGEIVSGA
ncbi:MAG: amidohydrolase family protein, partial [Gammaproteobacteria bacterium]